MAGYIHARTHQNRDQISKAIALGEDRAEETLTCNMDYRVIAGPGHLSPLKVRKARMSLTYDLGDGEQRLTMISIKSGAFGITLNRRP